MMKGIARAKEHSESKLSELRARLVNTSPQEDVIVTCGSYARREASDESDIDFFIISSNSAAQVARQSGAEPPLWIRRVREAISEIVPLGPAENGAFATVESSEAMLLNIGGEDDSNSKITRRMLFLLEGEWLFNADAFTRLRREMLERYVGEHVGDEHVALFLLNDIIRYYRTVAVDYEFKTIEKEKPKPWGIRNIKLVFARKFLYASGLFSVAMTKGQPWKDKISTLESLFSMTVIDRMVAICGRPKMDAVLASYNHFLERFEDRSVREHLKQLRKDERDDQLFRELKNRGHRFSRDLLQLFEETFDPTHPIRRVVVF
jgi:Nucleotidyltransferase domain